MTPFREDAAFVLPEPPAQVSDVGILEAGPAVVAPARSAPFLVETGLASVVGWQTGPVVEVRIGSRLIARDVRADVGPAANLVALPTAARRERIGPRGSALETIVALPALPLVAIQWQGSEAALPQEITLVLPRTVRDLHGRVGSSSVAIDASSEGIVAIGVSPPPRGLWIEETEGDATRVRAHPQGSRSVTLLIAAGSHRRVASAFAAAAHLGAHTRRGAEAALQDGLIVSSGVTEIDDAIHWARVRLSSALSRTALGEQGRSGIVWCTLAAIAASDRRAAAQGVEVATNTRHADAELLIRAYALAFGGDAGHAPTRAPPGQRGPARLPMVHGAGPRRRREAWIASLLQGEPTAAAPEARSAREEDIHTAASLFRSNPDHAWTRWRRSLAIGLVSGPGGPGTWDGPDDKGPILLPATAGLLLALAHGLLGLSPDAATGRIRLAPRLPTHVARFRVDGLAMGDATVSLAYERDGGIHCFTLEPTRGAFPPMAVFEPAVAGGVSEVLLDGGQINLDLRPSAAGTVVPLQLPLDGPRRVEIVAG